MSCDSISLFGTCPMIFIYVGSLDPHTPVLSPRPRSSHRSLSCTAAWKLSRDVWGLSEFTPLMSSQGHCPELPELCGLQIILPCISVTPDGRRDAVSSRSPAPARSRSVIFLNTEVFPKLGCVLSSEKLIKNKDSWASTQNSWCWRGCLGTQICTQSLKW